MIMRANRAVADRKEKKKGGFVYKPPSERAIKDRAEQQGGQYDGPFKSGADSYRAKDGDNTIRILPGTWPDRDHYGYDLWVHSFVGTANGTYPCLAHMKKKRCPICEASTEAKDAGEEEEARKLKATRRVVVYVLDRDEDKPIPKLYSMSWTMDRDISALCQNKRGGKSTIIDHPDVGYDLEFKKKGKGLNTDYYGYRIDRESSPICEKDRDQASVIEAINEKQIPDMIKFYTTEYLAQIMAGDADEKDEELDEDETAEASDEDDEEEVVTKKKKAKPAEDEDADDDEDEAEDEPAPKKKKKVVAKQDEDDDDEEETEDEDSDGDEEADEDEDEDKPAPKKKVARKAKDADDDEEDDDEDSSDQETSDEDEYSDESGDDEDEDDEDARPVTKKKKKVRR